MSPIFIFSTPEGGGEAVIKTLEDEGYKIFSGGKSEGPHLWHVYNLITSLEDGAYLPATSAILQSRCFGENLEKWGVADFVLGKYYGWGHKMWFFLANYVPDSKFIFCRSETIERNVAKVVANSQNWIPNLDTCAAKCEERVKALVVQQDEFINFYKEDNKCILITNPSQEKEKILSFIR